jgi:hypothetical protein
MESDDDNDHEIYRGGGTPGGMFRLFAHEFQPRKEDFQPPSKKMPVKEEPAKETLHKK